MGVFGTLGCTVCFQSLRSVNVNTRFKQNMALQNCLCGPVPVERSVTRGSDFLSDTPRSVACWTSWIRSLNTRNYLRVSLHGHQWWTDGWPQMSHRRSRLAGRYRVVPLRRRRRQPRAGGAGHARGILRHVVATFTHIPLRAGPPASMISRGGPGCSSFRRSGPGRPSLSLRSKACRVVVVVVAWAARDAARAVACATARAGTAGRWARSGSAEGFEPAVGRPPCLASVRTLTHGAVSL